MNVEPGCKDGDCNSHKKHRKKRQNSKHLRTRTPTHNKVVFFVSQIQAEQTAMAALVWKIHRGDTSGLPTHLEDLRENHVTYTAAAASFKSLRSNLDHDKKTPEASHEYSFHYMATVLHTTATGYNEWRETMTEATTSLTVPNAIVDSFDNLAALVTQNFVKTTEEEHRDNFAEFMVGIRALVKIRLEHAPWNEETRARDWDMKSQCAVKYVCY